MDSSAVLAPELMDSAELQARRNSRRERSWFRLLTAASTVITILLAWIGGQTGFALMMALVAVLCLTALIIRWPIMGFYAVLLCAVLVEQEPLSYPIFTDRLNVFYWPPKLAGLPERPIGVVLLLTFFVVMCHRFATRQQILRGGPLLQPFLLFLVAIFVGLGHGLATGGNFKIIVLELRPLWYLYLAYLLAFNLITERRHLRAMFWVVIAAAAIKGLQGCYIFFVLLHGNTADINEIMAHEDSFFFVALLLLITLFFLMYKERGQLRLALLAVPVVLIALLANNRRADYAAFLVAVLVAWEMAIVVRPQARKGLIVGLSICAVIALGYIAIFSHVGGSIGAPARGLVAIVHPDPNDMRDALSNQYRDIENYDLKFTERQNPLLGLGFGKPFQQPLLLPNILDLDPYYLYIPHNTILWVWMRLGPFGYAALWYLIGAIVVRGTLMVRRLHDPYFQLVGIYIVAVTFMEIILAYADYQLFFYRNVIFWGFLIGILMKLPEIERKDTLVKAKGADKGVMIA